MKINEMMRMLEPFNPKTRPVLTALCKEGKIPAARNGNIWFPDDRYVNRAVMWRKGQITLEEMIAGNPDYTVLSNEDQKKCLRSIKLYAAGHYQVDNCYSILFNGHFIEKNEIEVVKGIIEKESAYYTSRKALIPIKDAAKAMGVSVYQAKHMPALVTKRMQGDLYVDADQIDQMANSRDQYIGIYTLVTELVPTIRTAFDPQSESDRLMLRKYVRESELRELAIPADIMSFSDDRRNAFYFPAAYKDSVSSALVPFFVRYGLVSEKMAILAADPFWKTHPITKKLLDRFSSKKQENGLAALMETLVYNLHCEITECTDSDIEVLLAYAEDAKYKIYKQYICMYVNFCRRHADCAYSLSLKYDPPKDGKNVIDTSPYPYAQYFAFSYLLVEQRMIAQNKLVDKAFADIKYSLLWLYCIWQYCTAWRIGDFFKIPILRVPYEREKLYEVISNGDFTQEAITLSVLLENEINTRQRRPEKTAERQEESGKIFPLVVVFPENLRSVIGMVYAICVVMSEHKSFPKARFQVKDFEYMFGSIYTKILGHTTFQNRRANKAFMGTVVELAEKDPEIKAPVKGFALASFFRSHVVDPGTLCDMTSRYLQYKLEGLTVDEILMQLWDTGACSFVPYMLLEAVYGDKFSTLPVSTQTNILLESRLTAFTAEEGARLMRKSYLHDRDVVQTILATGSKGAAKQVLQGLINREAPSKQIGIMCPQSPLRLPCAQTRSHKCIVCPYKIQQTSSVFLLISDIEDMMDKMNNSRTAGSRKKYFLALRDHYFPAAYQLLVFSKEVYKMNVSDIANRLADMYEKGGLLDDPDQRKIP